MQIGSVSTEKPMQKYEKQKNDKKYKDLLDFTCIEKRKNVYLPHLYARGNSEITHRATSK